MGRILKQVLGTNFNSSKLRQLVKQALRQIAKLKDEGQAKYKEHLQAIHHLFLPYGRFFLKPSLRLCGNMIQIQNRLDAYTLIERSLTLLMERTNLIRSERECPDELKEAASRLIFAAKRCKKEIPQLKDIESILKSLFGKTFTGRAVELRNHSSATNNKLGEKLSAKPTPDEKANLLKFITSQKPELPLPNREEMIGNKRKTMENEDGVYELEDSSNSTHNSKKLKGETSCTNPYQNDFEASSYIMTRQKSKQTNLDSFGNSTPNIRRKSIDMTSNTSPIRTTSNPTSPTCTRKKNKGVILKTTSSKPSCSGDHTNALSSNITTIKKKKVVPLNTSPSRDSPSSAETRQKHKGVNTNPYNTRSGSNHKS